jgi:small multidrug resistance family-3 protein
MYLDKSKSIWHFLSRLSIETNSGSKYISFIIEVIFFGCEYMEKLEQFSEKDYIGIKRHLTDVKINLESRCISRKQCFTYTILLFILAGVFEIGGGYLIWLWLREGRGLTFAFLGAIILFLYGIVLTFQPADFHRIYATYGGIFVVMSIGI